LVVSNSCRLDDVPTDSISPTNAFRNVDDLKLGLMGAYAALGNDIVTTATIVGDEVRMPEENTVSNNSLYRWIYDSGSGSVTSQFYSLYQVIDRANRVLENIDLVQTEPSEVALKEQYRGELLALRGYAHFELLRNYASAFSSDALGVPYMKRSEVGSPARESFSSNMENIQADLNIAKQLIPSSFNDNTRITRIAISAILARVSLYNKQWDDAANYATEVIDKMSLASRAAFPLIWKDQSNDEVVWKLARVTGDSELGATFFRQVGEIALYVPSFKWLDAVDQTNDVRFAAYVEHNPGRHQADNRKSEYLINKYVGGNSSQPGLTDVKLFRIGEMYLIRAEAYAESNNIPAGTNDLNTLRRARISGYSNQNFSDKAALISAIYSERFIELAFEGQRFFDLKRRNMDIERWDEDLINSVDKKTLTSNDAHYNFPIPADEMAVNKNMDQNPHYDNK